MSDKKVTTTLRLDPKLRDRIKIQAIKNGKSFNDWILEAIIAKLKK